MKKIIITGATGTIGSAIVREALKQDYEITCLVRSASPRIKNIPKDERVHIIDCNIAEYKTLELDDTYDVFMHLAWNKTSVGGRDDVDCQLKNVEYTLDAVRLAKRCGCSVFIGAGSQAEYGTPNVMLKADTPVNPLIPYGVAKYAAGRLSSMECKKEGLEYNWVRILSVYGEHDNEGTLLKQLIYNAKNNIPMGLSGCEQIWDYLHEDDAGAAFVAVAEKGIDGKIYPLGSGVGCPLKEYVQDVISVVNPEYKPEFGKYLYSSTQPMYLVGDESELGKDTGWKACVDFKTGIEKL